MNLSIKLITLILILSILQFKPCYLTDMSKYLDKTKKINECGTQLAEALGVVCGNVYNKKRNNILRKYKTFNISKNPSTAKHKVVYSWRF